MLYKLRYAIWRCAISFTTVDQGEVLLLKYMLNHTATDNCRLHLFTNDYSPLTDDTLSLYTEVSASGYTSISLTGSQFTVSTSSGTSSAVYARQTFSLTTSVNAYGYYITNNGSSILIWAERFTGAPFQIPTGGGTIGLDPDIRLGDC